MTPTLHGRLTGNLRKNGSPVASEIAKSSKTVVFRHFFLAARNARLPGYEHLVDQVFRLIDRWPTQRKKCVGS